MASEQREDPVGYFLEDQRYHGKSDRTVEAYERVLRQFEAFLEEEKGTAPARASRRDCMAWVHELRRECSRSTVATYASYAHRFYAYMTQLGELDENPMALVVEEMDESIEKDPTRRDLSVEQMRSFVADVTHPLERAVVVTLLKTGMRVGELCNLDLRDLSFPGGIAAERTRAELDGRAGALYVAAATEVPPDRPAANKRKRSTIVPIDEELEATLRRWLLVRPDPRSAEEPVFLNTKSDWGRRLTPDAARRIVRDHAEERGWYRRGGGAASNVTPHYFRHFFTTHLRDRTGDRGIVKYLRGDVAGDIVDTYTHNWGGRVREVYVQNIYSLF